MKFIRIRKKIASLENSIREYENVLDEGYNLITEFQSEIIRLKHKLDEVKLDISLFQGEKWALKQLNADKKRIEIEIEEERLSLNEVKYSVEYLKADLEALRGWVREYKCEIIRKLNKGRNIEVY